MRFREGDTVEIVLEEGWEPKTPIRATVVRRIEEKRGGLAYLLRTADSRFCALTWRSKEQTNGPIGFHFIKDEGAIPDAEWALGFVAARRCNE